jgi:translation initiation factor 1
MGLFDGTKFERPVTCEVCGKAMAECACPRDAQGKVLLPSQQTAVVRVEKRVKGKMVTLVEGLDATATDLEGLLKALKNRCAAGGAVDRATGSVEVQGEHKAGVAAVLGEMGYRVKVR